ncbi:MAG: twin-arginine translocation signal domain-containing protein [Coriobacteriaceae bacterium]
MTLSKLSRRDFLKGAGATGGYDANPEMMQAWVPRTTSTPPGGILPGEPPATAT